MAKSSPSRKPQAKSPAAAARRPGSTTAKPATAALRKRLAAAKAAKSPPKAAPAKAPAPKAPAPKPAAPKAPAPKAPAPKAPAPKPAAKAVEKPAAPRAPAIDPTPKRVAPPDVAAPITRYSLGIVHGLGGRRLLVSGQVGVRADGGLVDGLEGQWDQALANLVAVLRAAGMTPAHVVKLVAFSKVPRTVAVFRAARDKVFTADPPPTSTYFEVSGLASPGYLCEIEAEAVAFD